MRKGKKHRQRKRETKPLEKKTMKPKGEEVERCIKVSVPYEKNNNSNNNNINNA
jgi:hypothetical protein